MSSIAGSVGLFMLEFEETSLVGSISKQYIKILQAIRIYQRILEFTSTRDESDFLTEESVFSETFPYYKFPKNKIWYSNTLKTLNTKNLSSFISNI